MNVKFQKKSVLSPLGLALGFMALSLVSLPALAGPGSPGSNNQPSPRSDRELLGSYYAETFVTSLAESTPDPLPISRMPAPLAKEIRTIIAEKVNSTVFSRLSLDISGVVLKLSADLRDYPAAVEENAQVLPAMVERADFILEVPASLKEEAQVLAGLAKTQLKTSLEPFCLDDLATQRLDQLVFAEVHQGLVRVQGMVKRSKTPLADILLEREVWILVLKAFHSEPPTESEKKAQELLGQASQGLVRREAKKAGLKPDSVISQLKARSASQTTWILQ